ncbi:MAG: cob(I)yrinic acid a,c-diamide adenosyltransferase [Atopobiaceae bacterium]|nr:cob(I)yrinic acid a,c-diamide adenosyltransferase [Atopobiaceae bacterium]MBR3315617.1 cob(I)yrinic acid a,c-diamide adenosyltransferase [Atopobiaceae bacterium]
MTIDVSKTNAPGLLHLYCGDGKGKTTAAMGLALRALGHGLRVVIVQFAKDGTSGEIGPLRQLGARVFAGSTDGRFVSQLSDAERLALRRRQDELLKEAHDSDADLLVLDEACFAARRDLVDQELLRTVVLERPTGREVVLTGRDPLPWMREAADYVTEMNCVRHPYARGVTSRPGVEY